MIRNLVHKLAVRLARASSTRGYAAARINRLTSDFITALTSADEEIYKDLRELRARSRQLLRDDDYFKNYIRKLKNNVVGHKGMTMKVESQLVRRTPSTVEDHGNAALQQARKLNKVVEGAWSKWGKPKYASASTKLSFCDLERLCVETVAVDGEAFFRYIYNTNDYGVALQQIDSDWFDEYYNEKLPNGNNIVMSVEMDKYDRPVRYWLTPPRHSYYGVVRDFALAPEGKRIAIDADEILHCFISVRPGQTRGVPMAHTVIGRIKDLDRYEGAELTNKTVTASKMGFITPAADAPYDLADLNDAGDERDVQILDAVEPGTIQKLPRGWQFSAFDPKSDDGNFAVFCKQVLRGIAAGLGIGYNLLTGDLEGVNYSSLRSAALDERDEWRALQSWMVQHFYEPIYEEWLDKVAGSEFLPIAQSIIGKVIDVCFNPRGWPWVDPEKDAKANDIQLKNRTTTYHRIFAEQGLDFEDEMEQAAYEQKYMDTLGLTIKEDEDKQGKDDDGAKSKDRSKSASAA